MIKLDTVGETRKLKGDMEFVFNSPQGKTVMQFMEQICSWYPIMNESMDTNDIVSRDANRRVLGTIKTVLNCSPEEINAIAQLANQ